MASTNTLPAEQSISGPRQQTGDPDSGPANTSQSTTDQESETHSDGAEVMLRFRMSRTADVGGISNISLLLAAQLSRKLEPVFRQYGIIYFQQQVASLKLEASKVLMILGVKDPSFAWECLSFMAIGQVVYLSPEETPTQALLQNGQVVRVSRKLPYAATLPLQPENIPFTSKRRWSVCVPRSRESWKHDCGDDSPDWLEIMDMVMASQYMGTKMVHEGHLLAAAMWYTKGCKLIYTCHTLYQDTLGTVKACLVGLLERRSTTYLRMAQTMVSSSSAEEFQCLALFDSMYCLMLDPHSPVGNGRHAAALEELKCPGLAKASLERGLTMCIETAVAIQERRLSRCRAKYGQVGLRDIRREKKRLKTLMGKELVKLLNYDDDWDLMRRLQLDEGICSKRGDSSKGCSVCNSPGLWEVRSTVDSSSSSSSTFLKSAPFWLQLERAWWVTPGKLDFGTAPTKKLRKEDMLKCIATCADKGDRDSDERRLVNAAFWYSIASYFMSSWKSELLPKKSEEQVKAAFTRLKLKQSKVFLELAKSAVDKELKEELNWRAFEGFAEHMAEVENGAAFGLAECLEALGRVNEAAQVLCFTLPHAYTSVQAKERLLSLEARHPCVVARRMSRKEIARFSPPCLDEWLKKRKPAFGPEIPWLLLQDVEMGLFNENVEAPQDLQVLLYPYNELQ